MLPGESAEDRDVTRRWREQATEQPSAVTDARIRKAAREAMDAAAVSTEHARRGMNWRRIMPFAAAASVALLAVGLVRLIPREEYQAIPATSDTASRPEAAPESAPAPVPDAAPLPPHVPPPLETEIERVPQDMTTGAPVPSDSRAEPRSARESTLRTDEAARVVESPPQRAKREPPAALAEGVPMQAAPSAPLADKPAEAPAAPSTALTTTNMRSAKAEADAAARLSATLAARVRDDAALRTGADPDAIRIVAADPVLWFDTSLGCEAGAFAAPEMRVPGYVVTVDAAGTTLRYHTDEGERIRICDDQ